MQSPEDKKRKKREATFVIGLTITLVAGYIAFIATIIRNWLVAEQGVWLWLAEAMTMVMALVSMVATVALLLSSIVGREEDKE